MTALASSLTVADTNKKSSLTVIGEIESVTLVTEKFQLSARIDTGAQTSSLSALNIKHYERDGKKWLRFQVKNPVTGKLIQMERRLSRIVKIKRHGAPPAERPVVFLVVAIGKIKCRCEFSLVDRSSYEFPVLIGRNFLSGRAVVDVSRKHVAHPVSAEDSHEN